MRLMLCLPDGALLGETSEFVVEVPWWHEVAAVVDAARRWLGLDVRILRLLSGPAWHGPPSGGSVIYLAEVDAMPRMSLVPWKGPDPVADHALRQTWARPGGPSADLCWAVRALSEMSISLTGAPTQVRSWNLSSIWRLSTDAGRVWLKVVPPFFAHEGPLLALLAGGPVPTVLRTGSGRMLMADVTGVDQYDAPPAAQLEMVRLLVDLQADWTSRVDELMDLGLPDLRGPALIRQIREVVARRSDELSAGERGALARLVAGLPERFDQITDCGLPDTLVHGDFHLGNIRGEAGPAPGWFTILDWGDSGVGSPLLDQLAFERFLPPADRPAVAAEWSRLWRARSAGSEPERAAALLRPVTALREAAVYQRFLDRIEPDERRYHDGDPVAELRKAVLLSDGDSASPAQRLDTWAP